MTRRWRSLLRSFAHAFFNLSLHPAGGIFEFSHSTTKTSGQFRNLIRAKKQQYDQKDDDDFAFLHHVDQLVAGLLSIPIMDEMFIAEKGQGAFPNDRRIRVAVRRELAQSVVATGIPHIGRPEHPKFMTELGTVMNEVAGVRRMGSAALDLAYVAAGRFDAYWESNLAAWDIAAGIVLVREAGGFVSDLNGRDTMLATGGIVAGNEILSRKLGDLLKKAGKSA